MTSIDSVKRAINASPEAIYEALTRADLRAAWLPPNGMTGRFEHFDAQVGGGYRMVLTYPAEIAGRGKSTADSDVVEAQFTELQPGRRVVEAIRFDSELPEFTDTMTMTWSLTPVEGGTEVTVVAENVPSGISAEEHQERISASLEGLARIVATG